MIDMIGQTTEIVFTATAGITEAETGTTLGLATEQLTETVARIGMIAASVSAQDGRASGQTMSL
jgi:hypothetical protein